MTLNINTTDIIVNNKYLDNKLDKDDTAIIRFTYLQNDDNIETENTFTIETYKKVLSHECEYLKPLLEGEWQDANEEIIDINLCEYDCEDVDLLFIFDNLIYHYNNEFGTNIKNNGKKIKMYNFVKNNDDKIKVKFNFKNNINNNAIEYDYNYYNLFPWTNKYNIGVETYHTISAITNFLQMTHLNELMKNHIIIFVKLIKTINEFFNDINQVSFIDENIYEEIKIKISGKFGCRLTKTYFDQFLHNIRKIKLTNYFMSIVGNIVCYYIVNDMDVKEIFEVIYFMDKNILTMSNNSIVYINDYEKNRYGNLTTFESELNSILKYPDCKFDEVYKKRKVETLFNLIYNGAQNRYTLEYLIELQTYIKTHFNIIQNFDIGIFNYIDECRYDSSVSFATYDFCINDCENYVISMEQFEEGDQTIVNKDQFIDKFNRETYGIFNDLNWDGIVIVGSFVHNLLSSKINTINAEKSIDLFIYWNCGDTLQYLLNFFKKNDPYYIIKKDVIHIYIKNYEYDIRIYSTQCNSPHMIIDKINLDHNQVYYNGNNVYCTIKFLISMKYQISQNSNSYLSLYEIYNIYNNGLKVRKSLINQYENFIIDKKISINALLWDPEVNNIRYRKYGLSEITDERYMQYQLKVRYNSDNILRNISDFCGKLVSLDITKVINL
jgi:hypothetical protein